MLGSKSNYFKYVSAELGLSTGGSVVTCFGMVLVISWAMQMVLANKNVDNNK